MRRDSGVGQFPLGSTSYLLEMADLRGGAYLVIRRLTGLGGDGGSFAYPLL